MDLLTSAIAVSLAFLTLGMLVISAVAWYIAGHLIYPPRISPSTPPADYALEYEPISFASRDGLTLRGWYGSVPESERHARPCTVMPAMLA